MWRETRPHQPKSFLFVLIPGQRVTLILIFVLFLLLLIFGIPILPPNMSGEVSSPGLKEYEISNSVSVWQNVTSGISGLNWALVWGRLARSLSDLAEGLSLHQRPPYSGAHWQSEQGSSQKKNLGVNFTPKHFSRSHTEQMENRVGNVFCSSRFLF